MATYAAYRHVELDKVGCGKRSIMKPPGGDCHDIFGADFHGTPSHHRVLKPPGGGTSSLFASPSTAETEKLNGAQASSESFGLRSSNTILNEPEIPRKTEVDGKTGNDSFDKIDPDAKFTDDVLLTNEPSLLSSDLKSILSQEEKRQRASLLTRNCVTGEGCPTTDHFVIRVHRQRDGNPVTGEGYDTPPVYPPQTRTRIPPGGYSSGLW